MRNCLGGKGPEPKFMAQYPPDAAMEAKSMEDELIDARVNIIIHFYNIEEKV